MIQKFALSLLAGTVLFAGIAAPSLGQDSFGTTDFQATGSPAAHAVFLQGLLHNFEYEDARASFLAAQAEDPGFVMAYWGEALTHEHPLWKEYDADASRAALTKLAPSPEARIAKAKTDREKAYLRSVNIHLALASQIDLAAGRTQEAIGLLQEAAELEASAPPDYGPAVPVQPIAELLGDVYRSLGETTRAKAAYEQSLAAYVGRERSRQDLAALNASH